MINSVKQAISNRLVELYPLVSGYTIYDEDIPQNFKTPSFLIDLIDQDYNKRLNCKLKSLLSFDIVYFSDKDSTEIKADCQDVQLNLFREFDLIGSCRVINKKAKVTDNVLHFTFDVNYSEMKEVTSTKMQQKQINMNI